MSWLFSRALVAEFSEDTYSDGGLSALSKRSPTPQAFLSPDRMTEFSRPSRFGMTFAPLTEILGAEVLTWCLVDSRAKTSVLQAKAQGLLVPGPACGHTWLESLAKCGQSLFTQKTAQPYAPVGSETSFKTLPKSGMWADGKCWELQMSVPITSGDACGWWPTPTNQDSADRQVNLEALHISATGLPKYISRAGNKSQMRLSQAVRLWPTPTVTGNNNRKGASPTSGDGLATAVRKFPTPSTRGINGGSHSRQAALNRGQDSAELTGGSLNPTWVEWLMGWPLGWTDLKPLVTDKSL